MPQIPVISGREGVSQPPVGQALQRAGFEIRRQKGDHVFMQRGALVTTVPHHRKLDRGDTEGDPQSNPTLHRAAS